MITLIGTFLGFIASSFPEILKFFREKEDKHHELAILDRQMELMKLGHSQRLEEIYVTADQAETQALYSYGRQSGGWFIDALSASVRPVITYSFFMLYATLKISQIMFLDHVFLDATWAELIIRVWHEEDQGLFATVMSFWFGQRTLSKFLTKRTRGK
jgi:hypothetical protein